jgi:hypothetical protein
MKQVSRWLPGPCSRLIGQSRVIQSGHELQPGLAITFADGKRRNEFGFSIDGDKDIWMRLPFIDA